MPATMVQPEPMYTGATPVCKSSRAGMLGGIEGWWSCLPQPAANTSTKSQVERERETEREEERKEAKRTIAIQTESQRKK